MREDVANGKCYCGAPTCIGTLFPHIIRDEESDDEVGNEGEEVGGEGKGTEDEGGDTDNGDDMDMDPQIAAGALYSEGHARDTA